MNVLVLHAHPEPGSFCSALKAGTVETAAAAGHAVEVSDLFAEKFNPVAGRHDFVTTADPEFLHYQREQAFAAETGAFSSDIAREQKRMARADLLVLHFPIWWGAPPAILKGWFDRVLAFGFAYRDGTRFDSGLFKGKQSICCVTTGGTIKRFSEGDAYGPIETVLWPIERLTLGYLGTTVHPAFVAYAAPRVDQTARETMLVQWRSRLHQLLSDETTATVPDARPLSASP